MKILFARPVTPLNKVLNVVPPIGLGYLATALRRAGLAKIAILDCVRERLNFTEFAQRIKRYSPEVVGLQIFSHDLPTLSESIRIIKSNNPKTVIIAGGAHPSGFPEQILTDFPEVDFAFKGEAEVGLPLLIQNWQNEVFYPKIPGLVWRDSRNQIIINQQIFPEDLDSLGFPAWDLLEPNKYPEAPQGIIFKNLPMAPIMISRGCPFACTFCAGHTITGRKIRFRSVAHVMAEIELLYIKYGIREIHILDDNFTFDKEYVKNFCQELLKNNFKISWCCPNGVRLDCLDQETLRLMKESGCYYVSVGIESGSDRILSLMKKGLNCKKIYNQINLIKTSGLDVNGFFILGYPGETRREIEKTLEFSLQLGLKRAAFYNFLPLPGTEIYGELIKNEEINPQEINWEDLFQTEVPYAPRGISKKQLKSWQKKAYRQFYFRPKVIISLLREIKTVTQVKYMLRRLLVNFNLTR